jgi:hypothetical protein
VLICIVVFVTRVCVGGWAGGSLVIELVQVSAIVECLAASRGRYLGCGGNGGNEGRL